MANYVLVHGAHGGGWQFRAVADHLQANGHTVYRPTLTGLGERAHLLRREINLDTHITDIVNVLEYEDLYAVILVGKSYGGMVITGVAERVPERLRGWSIWMPLSHSTINRLLTCWDHESRCICGRSLKKKVMAGDCQSIILKNLA